MNAICRHPALGQTCEGAIKKRLGDSAMESSNHGGNSRVGVLQLQSGRGGVCSGHETEGYAAPRPESRGTTVCHTRKVLSLPSLRAILPAALIGAIAIAATAQAAPLSFTPCPTRPSIGCGTLVVPLDRADPAAGTLSLHVERRRAVGMPRGVMVMLAGGPGQAGTPIAEDDPVAQAIPRFDYVMLDQRGTGKAGLRCSALDTSTATTDDTAISTCANQIGPRRAFYATRDSVLDLEDLRSSLTAERIALGGISYGTYVAQYYAQSYPTRVSHLVLDSVLDPTTQTGLEPDTFAAVPRVLGALCARRACTGITPDPVGDLAAVVQATAARPLTGRGPDEKGRLVKRTLGGPSSQDDLQYLLIAGDLSTPLRELWPGALRAARQGDPSPLLRIVTLATAGAATPPDELSSALYLSTLCADTALPWTSADPLATRTALADQAITTLGPTAFAPFAEATARAGSTTAACRAWPEAATDPLTAGPLPAVPTLLLVGGQDLRTPVEAARAVAARSPRATVVVAPGNGHSLLYSLECARQQMARVLSGHSASATACRAESPPLIPIPAAPAMISSLSPMGAPGAAGRVAHAARLAIKDGVQSMGAALDSGLDALPGVRGGLARVTGIFPNALAFSRFSAVRSVSITGSLRFNGSTYQGTVRVDGPGALDGSLTLAANGARAYTGMIGNTPVRIPLG